MTKATTSPLNAPLSAHSASPANANNNARLDSGATMTSANAPPRATSTNPAQPTKPAPLEHTATTRPTNPSATTGQSTTTKSSAHSKIKMPNPSRPNVNRRIEPATYPTHSQTPGAPHSQTAAAHPSSPRCPANPH